MAETKTKMLERILADIRARPTVPLWPHAGVALGIGRSLTYSAAREGVIDTICVGRRRVAISAPLRRKLEIDAA